MIFASGSCLMHSLNIIPQFRAISGDSYLQEEKKKQHNLPLQILMLKIQHFGTGNFQWALNKSSEEVTKGPSLRVD